MIGASLSPPVLPATNLRRRRCLWRDVARRPLRHRLFQSFETSPFFPESQDGAAVQVMVAPLPVLFAVVPEALVPPAVRPREDAIASLAVIGILPFVSASIGPAIDPTTMDHGVLPTATELTLVMAQVVPWTMDCIAPPTAFVHGSVGPAVHPDAILLASPEFALEAATLLPALDAETMLQVLMPLARVSGDLTLGMMHVVPQAVRHILLPLTTVDVPISVHEAPETMCAVILPGAPIDRAVKPALNAKAMPLISKPLARVGVPTSEAIQRTVLHLSSLAWRQRLQLFQILIKVRVAENAVASCARCLAAFASRSTWCAWCACFRHLIGCLSKSTTGTILPHVIRHQRNYGHRSRHTTASCRCAVSAGGRAGLQEYINNVLIRQDVSTAQPVAEFFCFDDPPGPYDSIEESRAFIEALEGTVHDMRNRQNHLAAEIKLVKSLLRQSQAQKQALLIALRSERVLNGKPSHDDDDVQLMSEYTRLPEVAGLNFKLFAANNNKIDAELPQRNGLRKSNRFPNSTAASQLDLRIETSAGLSTKGPPPIAGRRARSTSDLSQSRSHRQRSLTHLPSNVQSRGNLDRFFTQSTEVLQSIRNSVRQKLGSMEDETAFTTND